MSPQSLKETVDCLFRLSESRGREASGLAVRVNDSIHVYKEPQAASKFIRSEGYRRLLPGLDAMPLAVIGHTRLVTNGDGLNLNNQPIVKDGAVVVHNGIIANDRELWGEFDGLVRDSEVDTEVLGGMVQHYRRELPLADAARKAFGRIEGSASVAVLFDDLDAMLLATNTGSLYVCRGDGAYAFASEGYILKKALKSRALEGLFRTEDVTRIKAGNGCVVGLNDIASEEFSLTGVGKTSGYERVRDGRLEVRDCSTPSRAKQKANPATKLEDNVKESMLKTWRRVYCDESRLRRCTRCLLPETVPYIKYDGEGVCNYCRAYDKRGRHLKGEEALREYVAGYRSKAGEPDCIVGFSGGRDSTYGLHYVKNVLKMNPIAFTYDWGMVTDLGRRNQARVLGKLGVEQIVASADISKKRGYIRKNLLAWLRKPDLGMVPLLMAGDKEFYHRFHEVRKQTGVRLFIFCGGHEGEETPFKYGFCGIDHGIERPMRNLTGISAADKTRLMSYYLRQYIANPSYVNASVFDTLFAYYSSYILPDDYLYLYHYVGWDERKILSVLDGLGWERAADTKATWRVDDGTAAFYNYIYLSMAGFTEFDSFRSHQIREGKLTGEEAFELVKGESKPRFDAIEWYANAVGFDVNDAIRKIDSATKLY